MQMRNNLIWNVYREDFNSDKIEIYNIFNHGGVQKDLLKIKSNYKKFEKELKNKLIDKGLDYNQFIKELAKELQHYKDTEFTKALDSSLNYYFWSKSEYEIILTSWPPYIEKEELERLNKEETNYRVIPNLSVEEKIDIYDQIKLNFDKFIDYVWDNLDSIKKIK